jgi:hydrogenase small subunit
VVIGLNPGLPLVHLHNNVLALRYGRVIPRAFRRGPARARPVHARIEGSIPNEQIKPEGYWTGLGNDEEGQPNPAHHLDRLAGAQAWGVWRGVLPTYGGNPAMAGNPPGCMGLADNLG